MQWPKEIIEAKKTQDILSKKVKIIPLKKNPRYIAGVDAAFFKNKVIGVACLYRYPDLTLIKDVYAFAEISFPYIPGFLSFREGPVIIEAIKRLKIEPDVILFDGQGIVHPRGIGIATHIGILLDIPTIGCAKSRLIGEYKEPGFSKGEWSPLNFKNRTVGAVLRTREDVRPLFVSPGHRIDLKDSIRIVLGCTTRYRIPEPLRRADFISKTIKREF
jgi:deoxyribonuclease V